MIARLLRESKGIRTGIACNVICGCLTVGLSLLVVWSTREIVSAACSADRGRLTAMGIAFSLFLLGRILSSKCGQRIEAWCITRLSNRMRRRLFDKVMSSGFNSGKELHSADVVSRMSADVASLSMTLGSTIPALIVSGVSFAGAFLYLAFLAPMVAVIVAVLMPVAIIIGKLPASRTYRLTSEIREAETDVYRQLQDDVNHRVVISTIGYTDKAAEEFRRSQSRFFTLTMRRNDLGLLAGGAVTFGFMAGYAVMFLYCAYGLWDGTVSFATMTALLQLTAMVQRPVVDMSHKVTPLIRVKVSVERIEKLENQYHAKPESVVRYGSEIAFRNVWFRYDGASAYVLRGFDCVMPTGEVTAIYGGTGIGKTTILRLLLGLCRPERGEIYSPFAGSKARNMVYIPQGNTLFSGTVDFNLRMGNPEASPDMIEKALTLAAAEFVLELPEGIMTKCGENGYGFSEGQAQRIAIARGIIRLLRLKQESDDPLLILMDEPTSSLDSETATVMLDRMLSYFKKETFVIVTHKESIRGYAGNVISL